jgi:CCR4-NOT transcription complex subunit 1
MATEFAISVIKTLVTQESNSVSELFSVVDALSKVFGVYILCFPRLLVGLQVMVMFAVLQLAIRPGSPDSLQQLVEVARSTFTSTNYAASKDEKVIQSRDKKV